MQIYKKKNNKKKKAVIVLLIILLIALSTLAFYVWRNSQSLAPVIPSRDKSPDSLNESKTATSSSEQSIGSSKDQPTNSDSKPQATKGTKPIDPTGTFISNHRLNLGGSSAQSEMSSICHTNPGVKCTIEFTKGSTTVSLPPQVTDSDGNTSWSWDVNSIGLSSGEWIVTAKAVNGMIVSTSTDPIKLTLGS